MHPEIARARRALEEGRAAEARAVLDALDAGGLPREDRVERALVLARACLGVAPKDTAAALAALDLGLGVSSTEPRLNTLRAVALLDAGRLDESERAVARAVALSPEHADAHYWRGVVRERRGSLDKALRSYTRTLVLERAHLGALSARAHVARRLGRFDEACADLEAYLERVPNDAREWTALGVVRSELGAHDAALTALERAVAIAPGDLAAHFQTAVAAARKKDLGRMAAVVEELARLAANDRRVEWARGLLAAERGALPEAGELLSRAYRRALVEGETFPEPEVAVVAEKLFPVLKRSSRLVEARSLFEEALRKGAHAPRLLRAYARSFGRGAARGLRLRLVVRSRGQGDPPERLARVLEVEAETLDEAWDLAFEAERILGGQGLERGPVLEDQKISREDGPITAAVLSLSPRSPEEDASESEAPEPQGFEPEKGWTPDEEGQGEEGGSGGSDEG